MKFDRLCFSVLATCGIASTALADPPSFQPRTCAVRLDGVRLGADLTPGGSSLRNTFAYDAATHRYHLWVLANDDPDFPATSTLASFTHATSVDGVHFTRDGELNYEVGSADWADYGASIDPPLDFLRAAFDDAAGTWKLFGWTENVGASVGLYNYNTSVNDLGGVADNRYAVHQGPLDSPFSGNHAGDFGLVDGMLYLRVDSSYPDGSGGGNAQFAYTDAIPPSTGPLVVEANLFTGTPYCWGLDVNCGVGDPRIKAYVHNVGRTLRLADGSLATYYTFRAWDGSRVDKQIWTVASTDGGATWSLPAGVFADVGALNIDGAPLLATGFFSSADMVAGPKVCRTYFSTRDADDVSVMVSASTGSDCDALYADSFEGCGD